MEDPFNPGLDAPATARAFVPYTAVPQAEAMLEEQLGERGKLPLLDQKFRDGYVRYTPWVMLVFLPLNFVGVLLVLGFSSLAALLGHPSMAAAAISVVLFVLQVIALPGMFARTRRGWSFTVYSLVIGTFLAVLRLSLIGTALHLVFLWLAFQAKYEYS
jgi:hypothetical protein